MTRALAMISGGLDSTLAAKMLSNPPEIIANALVIFFLLVK